MHDASATPAGSPMPEARPVASHPTLPDVSPWEDHVAIAADLLPGSSQLDPVETSTGRVRNPLVPPCPEERAQVAITFRHSFWAGRRDAIRNALCDCGTSMEVLERFDRCGTNCWVMVADNGSGRVRLAADRCHGRWCEACQAERRRLICRNLCAGLDELKLPADALRFVTLTLNHTDAPLVEQLDRIYSCWQRLRQRPFFKSRIKGTIAFFEVTISAKDGRWHPHLHVMIHGAYIPKDKLSAGWKDVTGDSFIVDIKLIRNPREAAGYIAKYAAKAVSHSVWSKPDKLREAIDAFKSRRLFNTTGTFKKMHLSQPPEDDCGWSPLAPLYQIVARARAGDADAVHILRQLSYSNASDPIDAYLHTGTSPPLPDLSGPAPF